MDPRIGKADYGERYRKLYQTELSDNSKNHESNNASRHIHSMPDTICNKTNHLNDQNGERKPRNYRLISDPALQQGVKKVYSINGVIPGTNEIVVVRDPRHRSSKFYFKKEPTDLPVPMFKHDQHSVSTVLPKEVTFLNLNNNIDKSFLMNHCSPFGMIDNVTIYYHPINKKHLGIGSVLFSSTKAAKLCCEKLHNTSVMGNIMNVFVDIAGGERKRVIEEMTTQKSTKILANTSTTPFKSPTQNKLHKIASQGNIVELSNLQNKSDSSSNLHLLHADSNSSLPQNGVTTADLPTPSYSDLGYFSSRQSDASEHVLSSGGESVGSGNSSVILPADPRLSRSKDNARVVNDSPIGSDEFLPSTLNFNNLNSPFNPDQSKPSKLDPSCATILPRFSKIRNSVSMVNHSSPLSSAELEVDQVQNRDPRLTRPKDNQANCGKIDKTVVPNVPSHHSFSDLNTFTNQYHDNSASIDEEMNISCKLASESLEDKHDALTISLDTRIEAMLNQEASFGIPRTSSFSLAPILDDAFGQPDGIVGPTDEQQTEGCQIKDGTGGDDDDDDDRMSMSSCDEPKNDLIEVNVPAKHPQVSKPPPPLMTQWPMFQFQFQVGIPMMPTFVPSYPRFYNMFDVPDVPLPVQEDETSSKFRKVLGAVVTELKTVLSKDLRRKMVESTAFEVFDEWWSKNDLLDKKCGSDLFSQRSSNVPSRTSAHSMNDDGSSMLSFLFEGQDSQNRMGFGSGGLLGLRGIAAKLPSFRKKYRAPTPPPAETGENENHRITCASDSESDEESKENLPGISEEDVVDRESIVRFRSGSHHESSASDESSSDDEEIDEIHVRKSRGRRSQLILSDSGGDDESGSESGGTAMASDESDDDVMDKLEVDGHKHPLNERKDFLIKERRESLKRKHHFIASSEDESDERVFSKKLRHETSEESLIDANHDHIFDEEGINDSKKRKRQTYEGTTSNEKPSKVKRLEIDDSSSPILAVPTSESHTSCRLFFPSQSPSGPSHPKVFRAENLPNNLSQNIKLSDVTNRISVDSKSPQRLKPSRELQRLHCSFSSQPKQTFKHDIKFQPRDYDMEAKIVHSFLGSGIDAEDIAYLKESYEQLILADYPQTNWLNETHWFDHPSTHIPPHAPTSRNKKKRSAEEFETRHKTGSARTEGYYKISLNEKLRYLKSAMGVQNHMLDTNPNEADSTLAAITGMKKKVQQQSRDARSESRRWQSFFSSIGEDLGDLLKFNQLKFRKKQLKFAKSGIHDWGLFALERIQEGEMVIEYVGQVIRQSMADIREKRYESTGIGSSYLFRIDGDTIVDATKYGNLARFINHSCTPNCCAKIVTVESQKKIVIYSRRDIEANEEITYDYKFPLEDQKIPCLCGSSGCRGSLN